MQSNVLIDSVSLLFGVKSTAFVASPKKKPKGFVLIVLMVSLFSRRYFFLFGCALRNGVECKVMTESDLAT